MEINFITTLGLVAGVVSSLAFVPQVLKTWKSKSAADLSWGTLIILCTGITLWLVYGVVVIDVPVIAANSVLLILLSLILGLKIRFE